MTPDDIYCTSAVCVSHHAAADSGAAQGIILGKAGSTQLEREEVGYRRLTNQRVKERLQCLVRLERERERCEVDSLLNGETRLLFLAFSFKFPND